MHCLSSDVKRNVTCLAVVFAFGLLDMSATQYVNHCRPIDCYDLRCYGTSKGTDGPHTIYPYGQQITSMEVSCDQETNGGGWIIYQRRVNGTVNFTRDWDAYKLGFGDHGGNMTELWLGNENVYQLIQAYDNMWVTLRIEVDSFKGDHDWIQVSDFRLGNEALRYRINFKRGKASESRLLTRFNEHKRQSFKTFDNNPGEQDCLDVYKGGWWYGKRCGNILLNGEYLGTPRPITRGGFVFYYMGSIKPGLLERTRMMFRPANIIKMCQNPCKNGATCVHMVYDMDQPRGHRCVCPFEHCGPSCELVNPCKNGGTCEYHEPTKSTTCICSAEFIGPKCEDAAPTPPTTPSTTTRTTTPTTTSTTLPSTTPPPNTTTTPPPTTPPTTTQTTIMPLVGGIMLLSILIVLGIAAGVMYQRRQMAMYEEEELRADEERLRMAERQNSGSFQDYMFDMFGF